MLSRTTRSFMQYASRIKPSQLCKYEHFIPMQSFSLQKREKSSLVSILNRELKEEKGNCFEGEELIELREKIERNFKLIESPGNMQITMSGKVLGDNIRIMFDVQDTVDMEEDEGIEYNEEEYQQETEENEEVESDVLPGIRFTADVTRGTKGLRFECIASENMTIENMRSLDLEKEEKAFTEPFSIYQGPTFSDLEFDLQENIYTYLADRCIDEDMAQFISQYADLKEQQEYVQFLEDTAKFVTKA